MVHRGIKALGIREKLHDLLMKIMLLLFFSFFNDFYHYRLVRTTKYCFLFIFMVHQISFQLHIWFPKRMRVLDFQVPSKLIPKNSFIFTISCLQLGPLMYSYRDIIFLAVDYGKEDIAIRLANLGADLFRKECVRLNFNDIKHVCYNTFK